ncbi:putative transposase-associated domain-containing protein [Tanacetum coccineum]
MDKSWMYNTRRSSRSFVSGVEIFLDFAFERSSNSEGNILCPCSHCVNIFHHTRDDVFDHLICWGFRKGYSEWNLHGEGSTTSSPSRLNNEQEEIFDHDMHGLLNDIFHPTPPQQSIGSGLIGEGEWCKLSGHPVLFFGSQVDKVFYCEDPKNKAAGGGVIYGDILPVKDVFDMGSVTGQDVDQGQSDGTFNASHLHRIGDDGDDGEDVMSDMEHDGTDDEEDDVE